MSRLIDADILKIKLPAETPEDACIANAVCKIIDKMPTVDAVPVVHGRWYWAEDGHCKCSVCGQYATVKRTVVKTNFCPNCGVKMDGGRYKEDGT